MTARRWLCLGLLAAALLLPWAARAHAVPTASIARRADPPPRVVAPAAQTDHDAAWSRPADALRIDAPIAVGDAVAPPPAATPRALVGAPGAHPFRAPPAATERDRRLRRAPRAPPAST